MSWELGICPDPYESWPLQPNESHISTTTQTSVEIPLNLCVIYVQQCLSTAVYLTSPSFPIPRDSHIEVPCSGHQTTNKIFQGRPRRRVMHRVVWMAYPVDGGEWMDESDGNTPSSYWEFGGKFKICMERNDWTRVEITKSPCNESYLTVLK